MYGICIDYGSSGQEFEYLIADDYDEKKNLPSEFSVFELPRHTWAVFPCVVPMPKAYRK